MHLVSLALSLLLVSPQSGDAEPLERTHTVAGELIRLDLGARTVAVKVTKPRREYVFRVDPEKTRILSLGRELRLEDVPVGVHAYVVCEDQPNGRHLARLLRIGTRAEKP